MAVPRSATHAVGVLLVRSEEKMPATNVTFDEVFYIKLIVTELTTAVAPFKSKDVP